MIGEMPAEKQSKGRRDSLLPNWGQIIAIEYYRENDTLSRKEYVSVCVLYMQALFLFRKREGEKRMLTKEQLCVQNTMPDWKDISLGLYKDFSVECLLPKIFRYYLEDGFIINVQFKEWAMKHLWAIHHIDSRIDKDRLFEEIENGLDIGNFRTTQAMRKRLNDNKDRIRMFACVYQMLLIDRAINPNKTVEGLMEIKVKKLEIIEDGEIIEIIEYNETNNPPL